MKTAELRAEDPATPGGWHPSQTRELAVITGHMVVFADLPSDVAGMSQHLS